MATDRLILHRYASALHQLASAEGVVEPVEAALAALSASIAASAEVQDRLASPRLTRASKRTLLLSLLGQRPQDLVRRVVLLLADKGRAGLIVHLSSVFADVAGDAARRQVARVESAAPLSDDTRKRLVSELSALTGKTITLRETVSADLLGGLRVMLGSRMIDGSLRRRLDLMQERLMQAPLPTA